MNVGDTPISTQGWYIADARDADPIPAIEVPPGAYLLIGENGRVTVFSGNEGEEKAQRTFNYNFNGDAIKSTTLLSYNESDALSESTTYKGNVTGIPAAIASINEFPNPSERDGLIKISAA
mgnify:CR=1 FL=1